MVKLSDKLARVSDQISINRCYNGYTIEFSGQCVDAGYTGIKLICINLEEVLMLIKEYDALPVTS
jgi:hypothetical protein